MIELVEGYRFIETTLKASSDFVTAVPGGIYRVAQTKYPSGVFPDNLFCTFLFQGGVDEVGGGGIRIGVDGVFLLTVTGPGDRLDDIQAAANLMDEAIQGASGTTSTGTIYYLLREAPYEQNEVINTRLVTRLGGQYRTFIQKTGS